MAIAKPASAKTAAEVHRQWLQSILYPGCRVYVIPRYLNPSGQMGVYSLYLLRESKIAEPLVMLDGAVADVLGLKRATKYNGLVVRAPEYLRGQALVHALAKTLWPQGFACMGADRCPHPNHRRAPNTEEEAHHDDGGYAIRYREL